MSVIIGRSERSIADKHAAWRALISEYPDMPTPKNMHFKSHDSLHKILLDVIVYEEQAIAVFMETEACAVYSYKVLWNCEDRYSDSVFTTFERAFADIKEAWESDEATRIDVKKIYPDHNGSIEISMGYNGDIYAVDCNDLHVDIRNKCFPNIDFCNEILSMFGDMFYVDIPLPFQLGDILTIRFNRRFERDPIFILESPAKEDEERYLRYSSGDFGDGSDMIRWGYFVSDDGVLYGDHTGCFDSFEYYHGKLEGNNRLLHYVSLYLGGKLRLPELLVMQGRIMLERQLESSLDIQNHGVFIPDNRLAENQLI